MIIGILTILSGIILGLIYAVIIHRIAKEKKWDWWNSLVATGLSIIIAIGVGLILFNVQQSSVNESRKNQLKSLLNVEVFNIVTSLENAPQVTYKLAEDSYYTTIATQIPIISFEEAVRSGLFDSQETWHMERMITDVRILNQLSNSVLAYYSTVDTVAAIPHNTLSIAERINALQNVIDSNCRKIKKVLDLPELDY